MFETAPGVEVVDAAIGSEGGPPPPALNAVTLNSYSVLAVKPLTVWDVVTMLLIWPLQVKEPDGR